MCVCPVLAVSLLALILLPTRLWILGFQTLHFSTCWFSPRKVGLFGCSLNVEEGYFDVFFLKLITKQFWFPFTFIVRSTIVIGMMGTFRISSFVFQMRKNVVQVWNDMGLVNYERISFWCWLLLCYFMWLRQENLVVFSSLIWGLGSTWRWFIWVNLIFNN